jgi:hypothetical protein
MMARLLLPAVSRCLRRSHATGLRHRWQRPQPAQQHPQPERQPEPERISDDGWEEIIAGYKAGMVHWNVRRLGPEPGQPGCRAPRNVLRGFGL